MNNTEETFRLWKEAVDLQIKAQQLEQNGLTWLAKLYLKLIELIAIHLREYKDPLN